MKRSAVVGGVIVSVALSCSVALAALSHKEQLGKIMYQDKDFSYNSTQSCQSCHHRTAGFADPKNARDPYYTVVSTGADGVSLGGRNAPSSAYAGFSPPLFQDALSSEWFGGMFWDGRADGSRLNDPLAEQAQGPPLNPVEMNMLSAEDVVQVVRDSSYSILFLTVFGPDSLNDAADAYDKIGEAIAAYERSNELQKFSSRFDAGALTSAEQNGLRLFHQNCATCHSMDTAYAPKPLFTNYAYANIGIPANPLVPLVEADKGLGYTIDDPFQNGKFKIPTLRNVALTAPYGHNGYFATLDAIVKFKNNRPDYQELPPETLENISEQVGAMGMTDAEVNDVVQFLMTLTDN